MKERRVKLVSKPQVQVEREIFSLLHLNIFLFYLNFYQIFFIFFVFLNTIIIKLKTEICPSAHT